MNNGVTSVLFLAPEPIRETPTGPARRTVKLAEAVGEHCEVTLAAPSPSSFPSGRFATVETGPQHGQDLASVARGHDVAVVQVLPSPRQLINVRRAVPRLVVDLIAPLALELGETIEDERIRKSVVRWRAREMVAHLAAADFVLCSNEKQRDLIVGATLAAGLIDDVASRPVRERMAVVPHGLDPKPLRPGRHVLRTNGFASGSDRIAVWGGGMWSWLDPLTAIKAVERLRPSRPDLKLAFVGLDHPDPVQQRAHAPRQATAKAYVRDRGLDDAVAFRPRWLSNDEFMEHLQDGDVGISLNEATLEGRYASRTRVLDYLVAGLPVVCTRGDSMAELVESNDFGEAVAASDVAACASALDRLTGRGAHRFDPRIALGPLLWSSVARPLIEFCLHGTARPSRARRRSVAFAAGSYPAFVRSIYGAQSTGGVAEAVLRRAAALVKGRR